MEKILRLKKTGFFNQLSRDGGSKAFDDLNECVVLTYNDKDGLFREYRLNIEDVKFSESSLIVERVVGDL